MAKSGASKGAKKINAFNDGKLDGVNVAQGFVKRVEDLQDMSEADYDKGIKIIKESSQGRRDRLRRMKNFHRDMFPPV